MFWGCREVGDAVNEIYCVPNHFRQLLPMLNKGKIVNFGGTEELLEVQGVPSNTL